MSSGAAHWSELQVVSRSDVGRVRQRNEDSLEVLTEWNWLVLSDGMGGYRGGDVASRLAVETVGDQARRRGKIVDDVAEALDALKHAFSEANTAILRTAARDPQLAGMGATVVAAILLPSRVVVGHLGDSRLYRSRGGELLQLTHDHTVLQEHVDLGIMSREAARLSPQRSMLTRALGVSEIVEPDFAAYPALMGDTYLMCSDGVTDMIQDEELMDIMFGATSNLAACADHVVDLANRRGGRDNISLILAHLC